MVTICICQTTNNVCAWASYQIRKIAGCACAGNAGNVFPRRRFQRKPLVSDPGMHHGTCVTHVPWCMSGSLTRGDGENVPGIPGACAPAILRIWQEAHGQKSQEYNTRSIFCVVLSLYSAPTQPFHRQGFCIVSANVRCGEGTWHGREITWKWHKIQLICCCRQISLQFVSKGPINNTPAVVSIIPWRRPGDKLLSEPMMVSLLNS